MKTPVKTIVEECIDRLCKNFSDNSLLYFSESDLQSELFSLLLHELPLDTMIPNISVWGTQRAPAVRPCISRTLHTELHLPEGRIDLAVLDLAWVTMSVNSRGRFGHIQLRDGGHVFIEVKASRSNRSQVTSKPAWVKSIRSDIIKLNRYTHLCFLLCFDFSGMLTEKEIEALKTGANQNVTIRYFIDPRKDQWFDNAETANKPDAGNRL
jgi:hypothetical protein